jgi:hypothetical protein
VATQASADHHGSGRVRRRRRPACPRAHRRRSTAQRSDPGTRGGATDHGGTADPGTARHLWLQHPHRRQNRRRNRGCPPVSVPTCVRPTQRNRTPSGLVKQPVSSPAEPHRNRQLNAAIHRIAITQAHYHQPARDLLERRPGNGKNKAESLRILKRRISDVVYRALNADAEPAAPTSHSPRS